jgi:60 kDa SS-A/Ro ribonucleoprotein
MRFNDKTTGINKTVNYEGATAYKLNPELELYSAVCCALLQSKFYVNDTNAELNRIIDLISRVNSEFVAKLAVYTREQMHLRSIPLVLVTELAKQHNGDSLISELTNRIIQRADEITELLSYYIISEKRTGAKKLNKLSNQIKKGIAKSFYKFDEHQFSKYNRNTEIKLKDAMFLTHPRPRSEAEKILFEKIANDELETPYTWEVELSKVGQQHFDSDSAKQNAIKVKWEELIDSTRLGYMATLRNLRNFLDYKISQIHINKVANYLSDKTNVEKSKQLPFRFLAAYNELRDNPNFGTSNFLDALEKALQHSSNNIKGYDYNTNIVIASDVSASMFDGISSKSTIQRYDIGLLLSMLLQNRCKSVITGIFGSEFEVINLPRNNILQNVNELRKIEGRVGYSTNGYKVIEYLINNNLQADKIMMFTDCQLWHSNWYNDSDRLIKLWSEYKNQNKDAKLYLFDLAGYSNTPLYVNNKDVYLISGWSDKIFDALDSIEHSNTAIDIIDKIDI